MYDININNVKKGKKFYLLFLVVGLLFFIIVGSLLIYKLIKLSTLDSTILSNDVVIETYTDTEGKTTYSPTYYYRVNGQKYRCRSSSSSSTRPSTKNDKVYYNSKNPKSCMTEYSKSDNLILIVFTIISVGLIALAVINMNKINKRIKLIKELNQKGKLVKNLPYNLEDTGMSINNKKIKRPVINYFLPSGTSMILYGDPRHDMKTTDEDGMVDLVIDESNPNNYFIDFEINRLTGNLPSDYYSQNQ